MLTAAFIIGGLALLAYGYWVVLLTRYPEPIEEDEIYVVTTPDLWKIRLYRKRPAGGEGEPVLLCHSAGSNRFNFQFPRGASLMTTLVEAGYDCWMVELRGYRSSEPPFGRTRNDPEFDDYLLQDLPAVVDFIRNATGYGKIHWVGHSMGGMLLYAFDLTYGAEALASGTTLGAPPGFQGVNFRYPAVTLAMLRSSRALVEAVARAGSPLLKFSKPRFGVLPINWENVHPRMDTAAFFHLLEITPPHVAHDLATIAATKNWIMDRGAVDVAGRLDALETPLFAIFGANDSFIPTSRAEAFFEAISNPDKRLLVLGKRYGHAADYNHVDLTMSRAGRKEVFEPIVAWIAAHPIQPPRAEARNRSRIKTPAKKTRGQGGPRVSKKKPAADQKPAEEHENNAAPPAGSEAPPPAKTASSSPGDVMTTPDIR